MAFNLIEVNRRVERVDENVTITQVDVDYSFWKLLGAAYVTLLFIGGIAKIVAPAGQSRSGTITIDIKGDEEEEGA